MRVVADTTVVSGLLWHGAPRQVLDAARSGRFDLFTTLPLLIELEDVLQREKLATRLEHAGVTARELVLGYAALAHRVEPAFVPPTIVGDPDDDAVLACAVAAQADAIVSGDRDLLNLITFQGIPILTATAVLTRLSE